MDKRTKIVATVGPASASEATLRALIEAGVDVFRINFSHGDEDQRARFLTDIRRAERDLGRPVAICADLCGPKIRVGMIEGDEIELQAGQEIVVQRAPVDGTVERISTTLAELVDAVRVGEQILLADGRLRFEVVRTAPPEAFTCRVVVGGPLASGKGVNLPRTELPISALTEKDREDIRWIAARDFDYVALSFVQRAADVDELRALLQAEGSDALIITKIEKPQALDHIDAIIERADAVMVARGDLGVEMDFPIVPLAQKTIAHKCQVADKPCIIATEMMESMITSPRPTRAEVSDVANAVFDGADAVMLSAESSIGDYPIEAVTAMKRTVRAAEDFLDRHPHPTRVVKPKQGSTAALAASIDNVMAMQDVAAIAAFTVSGRTARLIAKNRPRCPVLALASDPKVARRAALLYGVVPRVVELPAGVEALFRQVSAEVVTLDLAAPGDSVVVLTGHPIDRPGSTRGLIIQQIG